MPPRAAAEDPAWRVVWVEKTEVSIPPSKRVDLIHRLIVWAEASRIGFLKVRNKAEGGFGKEFCVLSMYRRKSETMDNAG